MVDRGTLRVGMLGCDPVDPNEELLSGVVVPSVDLFSFLCFFSFFSFFFFLSEVLLQGIEPIRKLTFSFSYDF
jgi:hypothetical protein